MDRGFRVEHGAAGGRFGGRVHADGAGDALAVVRAGTAGTGGMEGVGGVGGARAWP